MLATVSETTQFALTLPLAAPEATLENVGGKGASLARLTQLGLPVPAGFHVTTAAYRQFVAENQLQPHIEAALAQATAAQPATLETAANTLRTLFAAAHMPPAIAEAIHAAYTALPAAGSGQVPVAVRSSATAEDLPNLSFAGQQETYLNMRGIAEVLAAVQRCWGSLWTARAIGYRLQHHIDQHTVSLAVVVQTLVFAEAAGVLFTANPLNGQRDQALLTATWGLGEAIVGGLVTPDTLLVEKTTGHVVRRETADKQVMTVGVAGGSVEQPVPEAQRRAPVLTDAQVAELVRLGVTIEQQYQMPMDIEWTWAAGQFAIVQARPITALPEPITPAPTNWPLPHGTYALARNNIVELMADPLTPLFATLGRAAINASMQRAFAAFGLKDILPGDHIVTVNHYAYLNGSLPLGNLLRVVFNSGQIMRKMFTGAVERWTKTGRPHYVQSVAHWQAQPWRTFSSANLLRATRALCEAAIDAYTTLVSGVIPAAWISEAIFTTAYNGLCKRRTDPPAPTYLLGFESAPLRAEKALYALATWARAHASLAAYLDATPAAQLATDSWIDSAPAGLAAAEWEEWQHRFQQHLEQFGHMFYNLDFANAVPADDPTPVLDTFKLFLRGQGTDPNARQQAHAQRREQALQAMQQHLKGWRWHLFQKLLASAQRYAPLREEGLADVGLGYPLLRQMFRELGQRLVAGGAIASAADLYWLELTEVEQAAHLLDESQPLTSLMALVAQRKASWRAAQQVTPPVMLPQMKLFGMDLAELRTGRARQLAAKVIKGVATSPGQVTAPARVLHGPEDFGTLQPGEVLVAAITTPAWTPLFARAAAVVTDVGGPLSHGSIVAREYGIPAVLGTGVATTRLQSGQRVTVDGNAGTVTVVDNVTWQRPNPQMMCYRASITEQLPDPLSPLFATLGCKAIGVGSAQLFNKLLGAGVATDDMLVTINGYAYYQMRFTLGLISGMLNAMFKFWPEFVRSEARWRDDAHVRYMAVIERWRSRPAHALTAAEILEATRQLTAEMVYTYNVLQSGVIGLAGSVEMIFGLVYDRLVKRPADPPATTFLLGLESLPLAAEKSLYRLAQQARMTPALAAHFLQTPTAELVAQLANTETPPGLPPDVWQAWQQAFAAHLAKYGHALYDLDFAKPLAADQPAPLLETCKMYLNGQGLNPYERQQAQTSRREAATQAIVSRLRGWQLKLFNKTLGWAQNFGPMREDSLADLGLGYPLLRQLLRELGQRLVAGGRLAQPEDVYWLTEDEVVASAAALDQGQVLTSAAEKVQSRRALWQTQKALTPPPSLPERSTFSRYMDKLGPANVNQTEHQQLKGVGASQGCITGPARVLQGPADFDQMRPGEILVATITTPAWTPLFAMAKAVVTDVGGILSHGSIVAREYGIPAVLGTGVATKRIHSGQIITVDGSQGLVKW